MALGVLAVVGGACGGGSGAPITRGAPTLRNPDGAEYLAHEVVVRIRPGVTEAELAKTLSALGAKVIDQSGPLGELGFRRVSLPSSLNADVAISRLVDAGTLLKAEPNYLVHASATPTDPRYGELWGMAKISAPAAWDITTGAPEVLVAVSDTGIDYNHPELVANAWTNTGEIPGNGKDDDGNGYVDDVHGYDFANSDGDPADDHGHGTHVSGTIGASANNGIGVAGLNWRVKIIGAKFLAANGSGSSWGGAQTILYAAKMKARVVNASWGCLGGGCYASYVEDAIRTLETSGGIFIAAAGNNGNNNDGTPTYPANYNVASLVAVAATDGNDTLAGFSNYGATKVHLAAPGVAILSTLPGGNYASWNGTSMATPHVAGAAALFAALRPDAKPADIKQKLLDSVDPVAGLAGKVSTGGRLNVRRLVASAGQAPAAPGGFNAAPGSHNDVLLSWSANTENDLASYRVRYGTATGIYTSTLDVPKTLTSAQVSNLITGTRYFFVVHAVSASGLLSPASVERSVIANDTIAPPQVVDLTAAPVPGGEASGEVVAASGEFSSFWAAGNAHDGSPDTAWITPGRAAPQEESLTIGLFSPFLIDGVDLLPSAAYPGFFPLDFDIEVSTDGEAWTPVAGLRNASATAGQHVQLRFSAVLASHVRLRVLRSTEHTSGLSYAALAELTVFEASVMPDGLRLAWTAPGDDPGLGRAARYDVRRATAPLTEATFAAATTVPVPGQPLAAGLREELTVTPLGGETTYYFALKAIDAAGNVSPLSNVASATTLLVPPSTITDLQVLESAADARPGTITLGWTAPGSDGTQGQAARYELRMSSRPLTPGNFAAATAVAGVPAPGPAGATERFAITDLAPGELVYFAIRAYDAGNAAGGLSNVVVAEPADGDDVTPPATVGDLSVALSSASVKLTGTVDSVSDELTTGRAAAMMLDGNLGTAWQSKAATVTTPAWVVLDYGKVQPLARFRMNPSTADLVGSYPQDFELQVSSDKQNWSPAVRVEGMVGKFGAWNEWQPPVRSARYVRLYVTRRGPAGGGSAVYAAVGELEVYTLTPELDADLTWVAPGDDGYDGRAARYELRRAGAPITAANFAAAQTITTLAPLPGGMIEVVHLPSLPSEATSYFALRAVDTSGNWSAISNVATLSTPGLPPAPVADLAVTSATKSTVSLTFTASGDDAALGTATAYELRHSTTPITVATWAAATPVPTGVPLAAGSREAITVGGLQPTTLYYFAVVVVDDVQNRSLLSNVVSAQTRDGTAPATVTDLAVSPVDATARPPVTMTVSDSSGSYTPETAARYLLDAADTTEWISPATAAMQPVYATFDLGGARRLGRLRMRAGTADRDLFPVDFKLEVQAQAGGAWTTAVSETGFATAGGWEEWMLGSVPAVAARLTVTRTVLWAGKYITALADLELYEDPSDFSKLRLSWTAPGDDGTTGQATSYDLRRAATVISETTFPAGTPVAGVQKPQPAGALERFEASGLAAETTYCFALKAADEEGNAGGASNSGCATTPGIPPATVTDLKVAFTTARTATLTFTAPGADGTTGRATRYELRRSARRINTANWAAATVVTPVPVPATAGAPESITVSGLTGLTTYFFALRAVDAAENAAALSNNASGTTLDDIPPSRVTDLVATTDGSQGGALRLTWTAPGDNGTVGSARSYDVRVSTTPIDDASFASATAVTVPAPAPGGMIQSATVTGLGAETLYYVALRAVDTAGNVSATSNVTSARTREEAPGAVTDLAIIGGTGQSAQGATLVIQWTAPGDDGTVGTATGYDIRTSTSVITAANFAQATPAMPAPAPATAGTVQKMTLGGLAVGTKIYVALKTADDRGNLSGLSNVASATTPDEVPPAAIVDLMAAPGTAPGTLSVSLTAPGDDGTTGRATSYDLRWSTASLDAAAFGSATVAVGVPAPATAGTVQTFTISGLPNEASVYLMLRTRDDAGNVSALSNQAQATTPEVPPAAVSDLRSIGRGVGTMTLGWTASGDDGKVGTAAGYELRYSTTPLTDATFAAGTLVPTGPAAGVGSPETAAASGLTANKTYYFALKVVDDRGNRSALSNVVTAASQDTIAPGGVVLAAAQGASPGTITLSWLATGDDGTEGTAARYELRRSSTAITAANWPAATVVTTAPPKVAGAAETMTVSGLTGESTHHFAIRAIDEADNLGPLSNDAAADTLPVPPATINLTATLAVNAGQASATLTWSAPGDDGTTGRATGYDLRKSTTPITAATFATATVVPTGTPAPAGGAESVAVSGLTESTTYYFAIKAVDDTQTWGALSNVATVAVPDLTRPGAPVGLAVTVPDTIGRTITPAKVTPSSVLGPSWQAGNATDGDATSSWASAGSDDIVTQSLVLDLGSAQSVEQVKLTPDAKYLTLFPRGFTVAVSADNATWKTVVTEQAFTVTSATTVEWGFPSENARYVRLAIDDTGISYEQHYAILAEFEVVSAAAPDGRAQLTWLAPGDDGSTGTAKKYEVYRHTSLFNEATLGAVTPVSSVPAPLPAGALQTMTVTALHGETTYYWAVRAIDEAGNVGPLSAVVSGKTNNVPPAAVRTLTAKATGNTTVALTWTATGDDGLEGVAASYEIRYSSGPLSAQNFADATLVPNLPAPAAATVPQAATVSGLTAGVTYRFALRAKDAAGNASFLSNVAVAKTNSPPDVTPPSAITDLTVATPQAGGKLVATTVTAQSSEQSPDFKGTAASDGNRNTFWASTPRASTQEEWVRVQTASSTTIDRVSLWPSAAYPDLFPPDVSVRVSPDGLAWTTVASATNVTAAAGVPVTLTFAPTSLKFIEVRATRLAHPPGGLYYAALAEVEAYTANEPSGTLVASWTAPADDGPTGGASSYDLRVGACPFNPATAATATTAVPLAPASPERVRITGKMPGTYCVAVRSADAAGNVGAFSNVVQVVVP